MRMFWVLINLMSLSLWANQAVLVSGAHYNPEKDLIEVTISYVGGCIEHRFSMEFIDCIVSKTENIGMMNICDAQITDLTTEHDQCQSIVTRTLQVSLGELNGESRPHLIGFNHSNVVFVSNKG